MPDPSSINLTAKDPRPCAACHEQTLMVVTTTARYEDTAKPIDGWALCTHCGATPHPLMEAPVIDLTGLIADWMRQAHEDAAQALADMPADQPAGVLVTPVFLTPSGPVELDPVAFYRPAEALRG